MTSPTQTPPLIEYPTAYPFKVMGPQAPGLREVVQALFERTLGIELLPDAIVELPSSKGKYVSFTVTVELTSEEQRRAVYAALHQEKRIVYYL